MIISYCYLCHKAGLRWDNPDGKDEYGQTGKERWKNYCQTGDLSRPRTKKWCPRCKQWVNYGEKPTGGTK